MSNFAKNILTRQSDKLAIVDDLGSVTYKQLGIKVKRYANHLSSTGIGPGDNVVVALPDSIEWCVAFLAIIYVGAVAIIISAKTPHDKISSINAKLFLTSLDDIIESDSELELCHDYTEDEIGFYLTTSGTTGHQKFIVHSHRALNDYYKIISQPFDVDESSVLFSSPRLSFGYGVGVNIILGLGTGSTIILTDKVLSSKLLGQKIIKHNISHFFSTPIFLSSLIKYTKHLSAITRLKVITSAGEPLSKVIKQQFLELYNKHVLNGYGLSEVLSYVCSQLPSDAPTTDHRIIGKPINGVEIDIRDGELYVKHPCVAFGYLDKNREDIFQHLWIKTNDLVEINEQGELVYISRKNNLVKISGLFVSIDEVEDVILQHTGVKECLVYTKEDNNGLLKLEANIISDNDLSVSEMRKFLRYKLEPHKIPKHIHFVDQILKTLTNKKVRIRH